MDIASIVAQKIEEGQIKPLPKSHFVIRHVLVWTGVAGSVVLTGMTMGIIVYLLSGHEWHARSFTGTSLLVDVFRSLPYFWLAVSAVLLAVAVISARSLRRGYSVQPVMYVCMFGATALLVGVIVAETGEAQHIEEALAPKIPLYETLVLRPQDDWALPEFGFIGGNIVESTERGMQLSDCRGGHWVVDASTAIWRCGAENVPGSRVKLIGAMRGPGSFVVTQVLPWDVTLAGAQRCARNRVLAP